MPKERISRKKKKMVKKKYSYRYGIPWLSCEDVIVEYKWFFKNQWKVNMNKRLTKQNFYER